MIYFISDCHLGLLERSEDKKREDLLLAFMEKIRPDCERLVIVGDFFDYWFEWDFVCPKYFYRTLAELYKFRSANIPIDYLMGNHDFGHKTFFSDELDIEIHRNDLVRNYYDKKFYLFHGDGLSYKDGLYRILKKILRNPFNLKLYLNLLHPDFAIKMAHSTSKKSRKHTDKKLYGDKDGMTDFAIEKIEEGFDYVIFGHRHKLTELKYKNGTYINLGDWLKSPHFGAFDGKEFKLISVIEFLK